MIVVVIAILQRGLEQSSCVLPTKVGNITDVMHGELGCRTNGPGDPNSCGQNLSKRWSGLVRDLYVLSMSLRSLKDEARDKVRQ